MNYLTQKSMAQFKMAQAEMDDILAINKGHTPGVFMWDGYTSQSLAEKINNYWTELGKKYGFDPSSVTGQGDDGVLSFIATPK